MDPIESIRRASLSVLVVGVFALPPVVIALWPTASEPVVVIGDDVLTTMSEAGGRLIAVSEDGHSVVTRASAGDDRDFVARLRRAGARAVLAAPSSAACTTTPARSFSSAHDPRG